MSTLEFPQPLDRAKIEEPKSQPERKPRAASSGGRQAPLQARLQEAIGGIGFAVAIVNEVDGLAIIQGTERLAIALDKAAKQSPSVRRTLEAFLTGSVWAEVTFAVGAIAIPIALNHGVLPGSMIGLVPGGISETGTNDNGDRAHAGE